MSQNTPMAFVSETRENDMYLTTFKHTKSLYEDSKNLSAEDFQMLVPLAAAALKNMNQSATTIQYKEAIDAEIKRKTSGFDTEKARLEEDKVAALAKKDKEIAKLQGQLDIANLSKSAIQDELGAVRAKTEANLLTQFEGEKARFREREESLKATLKEEREFIRDKEQGLREESRVQSERLRETLENQARERVAQCDKQHRENMEQVRKMYDEQLAKERKESEKVGASVDLGVIGEQSFAELLAQHTSWGSVENTSKVAHSTDLRCLIRKCPSLFEVKNHSSTVKTAEVTKFERDMEINQDCPLGVFVSLKTNITGKNLGDNYMTCEWSPKSQLLIYINSFYTHSIKDIFAFIDICADIAVRIFENATNVPKESETINDLEQRIEQAKVYILKDIQNISSLMTKVHQRKTFWINTITKETADYISDLEKSKGSMKRMLDIILGKTDDCIEELIEGSASGSSASAAPPPLAPVSTPKKRPSRAKGANTKPVEESTNTPSNAQL